MGPGGWHPGRVAHAWLPSPRNLLDMDTFSKSDPGGWQGWTRGTAWYGHRHGTARHGSPALLLSPQWWSSSYRAQGAVNGRR